MRDKKIKEEKKGNILRVSNSRKFYIPFYFMAIILWIIVIYIKISGKSLDNMALNMVIAFSVAVLIATEIHRLGNSYEINESSVIHRKGYLSIISKRIEFGAISDVDVKQNLWQRFLYFGDVEIFKFSEKSIIRDINNPFKFVEFLEKKLDSRRGRVS